MKKIISILFLLPFISLALQAQTSRESYYQVGRSPSQVLTHGPRLFVADEETGDVFLIRANTPAGSQPIRMHIGKGVRILGLFNDQLCLSDPNTPSVVAVDLNLKIKSVCELGGNAPCIAMACMGYYSCFLSHESETARIFNRDSLRWSEFSLGGLCHSVIANRHGLFMPRADGELLMADFESARVCETETLGCINQAPFLHGSLVYVPTKEGIVVLNSYTRKVQHRLPELVGARLLGSFKEFLFVSLASSNDLVVVETDSMLVRRIALEAHPNAVAVHGGHLLVALSGANALVGFDAEIFEPTMVIALEAQPLAIGSFGARLYVTLQTGRLLFIQVDPVERSPSGSESDESGTEEEELTTTAIKATLRSHSM